MLFTQRRTIKSHLHLTEYIVQKKKDLSNKILEVEKFRVYPYIEICLPKTPFMYQVTQTCSKCVRIAKYIIGKTKETEKPWLKFSILI